MKRFISLLLAVLICFAFSAVSAEEDTSEFGDGSVEFFDDSDLAGDVVAEGREEALSPDEQSSVMDQYMSQQIIGTDDRVTINNVRTFPYCAIAYLEAKGECGCTWCGSGFICSKGNTLLTAAHCLVCDKHGKWADKLVLYFGYKNKSNYAYRYTKGWTAYVGNTFRNGYSIEHDWGVVKLREDVSKKVGGFGAYWNQSDSAAASTYVAVAGYRDNKLKADFGFLNVLDSDHVYFYMDEVSGNSGGPIFTPEGYAVGIIIAERTRNGKPLFNIGFRLNEQIRKKVNDL